MLPGNPYSPLNAGIAPAWLRMNSSATCVELAGRDPRAHRCAQRARTVSREDLAAPRHHLDLACRLQLNHFPKRLRARAYVTSSTGPDRVDLRDLRRRARWYQSSTGAVCVVVDAQPVADRLGLVVLAAHERAAALVARVAGLAARVRRLALLADGARRSGAARSRRRRCRRASTASTLRPSSLSIARKPFGLRHGAHDAVEDRRRFAYCGCASASLHDAEDDGVGHEVAAVHVRLAPRARAACPSRTRRAKHVAGRERRDAERRGEQRRLRSLSRAGLAEENDDHCSRS